MSGAHVDGQDTTVDASQRWSDQNRCPACNGAQTDPQHEGKRCHGYDSEIGPFFFCSRKESSEGIEPNGAGLYMHWKTDTCRCKGGTVHGTLGCTVEMIAEAKGFDVEHLKARGWKTVKYHGADAVLIPYTAPDGMIVDRLRLKLTDAAGPGPKFIWKHKGTKALPYGLEDFEGSPTLDEAWICEGETNKGR